MANLIRNLIELHGRPVLQEPLDAPPDAILNSFVPTRDAGRVCARIVTRLASPGPQTGALLLSGPAGSGRTHILRYAETLLADPQGACWEEPLPPLNPEHRPRKALGALFVSLPANPLVDLASFLCTRLAKRTGEREATDPATDPDFDSSAQAHLAAGLGLLVLEGLSGRIRESTDPSAVEGDRDTVRAVVDAYSRAGILVVVEVDDDHMRRRARSPLARLRECGEVIWITRNNLLEVIAATAVKTEAQRQGIRDVLSRLRREFPTLGPNSDDFVEIYPLQSSVFDAFFRLSAVLPAFAPLHFLQIAIREILDQPATSLITPDKLFDFIERDLRLSRACMPIMEAYDEIIRNLAPELKPAVRPVATTLLKACGLGSIRNPKGTSVRALAHQCLLEDAAGALSGYGMVSAIMTQLEELDLATLSAEGEGVHRCYRLRSHPGSTPESGGYARKRPDHMRLSFPLMLFDWVHSEIPSWHPETTPQYTTQSQSLGVPLPDFDPPVKGTVYFKHPNDPMWTDHEIYAMRSAGSTWALLVLSPFEAEPDLEQRLRAITESWDRVLIWRPGTPTRKELARLRKLSSAYGVSNRLKPGRPGARAQTRRALGSLYVTRGVFQTLSDQWHIAEDVSAANLTLCVSRGLASLLGAEMSVLAGTAASIAGEPDRRQKALRWAAIMPGPERLQDSDPETAEQNLLAWWASRLEVDCPALVARLHSLPECMVTTRMWEEVRIFENSLGLMRSVFQQLRMGEMSLLEALQNIAHHFGNDESRIARWRLSLDRLAGLGRWVPSFEYASDYLAAAFETGLRPVDDRRLALLDAARQPHHFLEPAQRDQFDAAFLSFKKEYAETYATMHRDVLGRIQSKVDAASLRNLELLSNLPHADSTNWQKVKLIGRWAQRNQCDLPVREILERYPRCYCNFNPAVKQHLADPGAQINRLAQEGIEALRTALRNSRKVIIEDLQKLDAGDEVSRQLASLISNGPLVPVGPECIDLLGRIIQDHTDQFRKEFLACRNAPRA